MCRVEQERGQLRCVTKRGAQSLILANGPAGPETAELNNVTLHRDKIAELSCIELGKLKVWQSLANGPDGPEIEQESDRMDESGKQTWK